MGVSDGSHESLRTLNNVGTRVGNWVVPLG